MLELLTQTFNASVVAVTQLLLSTVVTTNPWFDDLQITFSGMKQEIVCSTKLSTSFTETLDDVLLSGENITLHFKFDLYEVEQNEVVHSHEVVNGFRFDPDDEIYYLYDSETQKVDRFFTIEAAKDTYISVNNLDLITVDELDPGAEYFLQVSAYLDPIKMENVTESVNLMLRWASVKPTIVSENFRVSERQT